MSLAAPKWDSLTADEKKLYTREAEVFGAYAAYTSWGARRSIRGNLKIMEEQSWHSHWWF